MKRILTKLLYLPLVALTASSISYAGYTEITDISKITSTNPTGTLREAVNTKFDAANTMFSELYTADGLKANISCFADATAFNECFGLDWATVDISGKQDLLVSGTNIKTVNGTSLLGSGNITIEGSGTLPTGTNDEDSLEWDTTTSAWVSVTLDRLAQGTGITITEDGGGPGIDTIGVTANTYQSYAANLTAWADIPPSTGSINTTGTMQSDVVVNSYSSAQTLTAAAHNSSIVQMTVAGEVTLWDCEDANVGNTVVLWARDAEKIEVVPASGDHFNLFNGTALTADYELDIAATAGTKVTLMCTADDTWSVFSETAASTDGGVAD